MTLGKIAAAALSALVMSVQAMAGVNLNTANAQELESLRGIGAATAQKIIDYRSENTFDSVDEIMEVKGIGEKKFEAIRNDLEV